MNKTICLLFVICSIFMIACSNDGAYNLEPENLERRHSCADDGMVIVDYNGPKAQILWKNGKRTFYCEVREAFYEKIDKIKEKQIVAFFVQDFTDLEWGSYIDKWIRAEDAVFIINSNKDGAMGLSYVPFSNLKSAELFMKKNGGQMLKFSDINVDVLSESNGLLKKRLVF